MREVTEAEQAVFARVMNLVENRGDCPHLAKPEQNTALKARYTMEICGIPLRLDFYRREANVRGYYQLMTNGWTFHLIDNGETLLVIHDSDERFDREIIALKMAT